MLDFIQTLLASHYRQYGSGTTPHYILLGWQDYKKLHSEYLEMCIKTTAFPHESEYPRFVVCRHTGKAIKIVIIPEKHYCNFTFGPETFIKYLAQELGD